MDIAVVDLDEDTVDVDLFFLSVVDFEALVPFVFVDFAIALVPFLLVDFAVALVPLEAMHIEECRVSNIILVPRINVSIEVVTFCFLFWIHHSLASIGRLGTIRLGFGSIRRHRLGSVRSSFCSSSRLRSIRSIRLGSICVDLSLSGSSQKLLSICTASLLQNSFDCRRRLFFNGSKRRT